MSWLPPHVGAPSPVELFQSKGQWNLGQPAGPISSSSVNPYLAPIAKAELAAEAAVTEATGLANQAAAANEGYDAAFSKIRSAVSAWRGVRKLALAIDSADPQMSTAEQAADMAQAKVAVPGILGSVSVALAGLVALQAMLRADQAQNRPDLPPAKAIDPDADDGLGWGALAIAGGIAYLLYKAVF